MNEPKSCRAIGGSRLGAVAHAPRLLRWRRIVFALCLIGITSISHVHFAVATAGQEYLARAQEYFEDGAVSSALIEVKNAVQAEPNNPQARLLLGRIHLRAGNPTAAEEAFLRARELGAAGEELALLVAQARLARGAFEDVVRETPPGTGPLSVMQRDLFAARGDALLALDKLDEAELAYDRALQGGEHAMALRGKASVALARGQPAESRRLLDRALLLAPDNDEIVTSDAEWYLRAGSYQRARERFARAVVLNPIKLIPRLGHVRALLGAGDVEDALREIAELRQVQPADTRVALQYSLVQLAAGNYQASKRAADAVLAQDPYNAVAANLAGSSAYALELYEQAVARLTFYLQTRPEDNQARILLGTSYLRLKDPPQAKIVLQPLLDREAPGERLLSLMATAEALEGNMASAASYLDRASRLSREDEVLRTKFGLVKVPGVDPARGSAHFDLVVDPAPGIGQDIGRPETTLIMALLKTGDYAAAHGIVERLQAEHPNDRRLLVFAGIAHTGRNESSLAEAAFARAIERYPTSADARLNLARLRTRAGDLDGARSLLEEVLVHQPDHLWASLQLASMAGEMGDTKGQADWLERVVAAQPELPGPRIALARIYLNAQQSEKVLAIAQPALDQDPENHELLGLLGQAQIDTGMIDAAILTFSKLASIAPEKAEARFLLAKAYGLKGQYRDMQGQLEQALERDPDHLPSQIALTRFQVLTGKLEQAGERIQALKAAHPGNAEVIAQEGWMLLRQGRTEEAVMSLKAAFDQAGANANRDLVDALAQAHWAAGQWTESIAIQEGWLASHPKDGAMLVQVAQAYMQQGRADDAASAYRKVQAIQPNNVLVLNNLAWLLRETAPEEALGYAERANALAPGTPSIMDTLAWLLLERGNSGRAVALLEEATQKAPDTPQYRYHMAQALAREGQAEKARRILEELLMDKRLEAEHPSIRQMLQQFEH